MAEHLVRKPLRAARGPVGILAIVLTFVLAACAPGNAARVRDVERLSSMFPLLESMAVTVFRDVDDCRVITYARGRFSSDPESPGCNWSFRLAVPFDDQARTDFRSVKSAVDETGVPIRDVWVYEFDATGHVKGAEFGLDGGVWSAWSYVFVADGQIPDDSESDEGTRSRINEHWYFWDDDPN